MATPHDETRPSTRHWFVRGGTLRVPDKDPVRVGIEPILIGRDPSCGIVLADRELSAIHCDVRAEGPGVLVRDLGSKNGTFVGAVRIREALLTGPCVLLVGGSQIAYE